MSFDDRKKELAKERQRRWRERHPNGNRDSSRRWRAKNRGYVWPARKRMVEEYEALKAEPCLDCGGTFPPECMDFDHLDPTEKVNNVGTMVAHGHSRESILAEIAKCELICANCHRVRTRERAAVAA